MSVTGQMIVFYYANERQQQQRSSSSLKNGQKSQMRHTYQLMKRFSSKLPLLLIYCN